MITQFTKTREMAEEQTYLDGYSDDSDFNSDIDSDDGVCTFCLIAKDLDEEAQVIKRNEELVCFKDIVPAAPHHYLVVPREHIKSCFSLQKEHVRLVERMAEFGKAALQEQGVKDMEDISLGFHRPPFTSVDHLHLHVLAPSSQVYSYLKYKFIPGTHRFITVNFVQHFLEKDGKL